MSGEADLPITSVTLFSSGVAYVLREGAVDAGSVAVSLTFQTAQINDILKSLVLLDEGGRVQAATLPTRDPVGRTLQSFAVDVTGNPSRADLLRRLRGTPVALETTGGESLSGRVVSVESREEIEKGREITIETVTLLTEGGMVATDLPKVRLLRLLDERLERELRDALAILATSNDDNRRPLTLRFQGEKSRTVRVGYIVEAPVWKVSYRLALEDGEADGANVAVKPYLQGWALVENTSDDDWNGVQLSLVSGRPISFIQDLYQPLYAPRPVVPVDTHASPYPQAHSGAILLEAADAAPAVAWAGEPVPYAAAPSDTSRSQRSLKAASLRQSVPAQAAGQQSGELFEYRIAAPVQLPRQQAAMIPIVSDDFEGEKLSLYNADSDPRFPMNAFRLRNNSLLHLKGGAVTVFDGGTYAGDALIEDIPPGDSRLVTYAVDLAVEGERQFGHGITSEATLSVKRGVLYARRFQRVAVTYTFRSSAKVVRKLLVEHPFDPAWTLIEPEQPAERTADRYRFVLTLAPGETRTLRVAAEQPLEQTVALLSGDVTLIERYAAGGEVSERLRESLQFVIQQRSQIETVKADWNNLEQTREAIHDEQKRIRENMAALERDSALYRRYVDELDQQETQLADIRAEAERIRKEIDERTQALQAYLDTLDTP